MHRQLADDTPDRKGVSVVSIEAAATVDVHRDRPDPSADDTDRLDADAMLVRKSRRQQQPGFNRKVTPSFSWSTPSFSTLFKESPGSVISSSGLASTRNSPTASQFFAKP